MWSSNSESIVVGLSLVVQFIGLSGVVAARLRSAQHPRRRVDWFILACFAVVGTASALLMPYFSGCGLAVATTMPLMAVAATLDLKGQSRATAF
jgi:hypothetical protein